MTVDIFNPIISGAQVEGAVIHTLDTWLPTYLRELELQYGRPLNQIKPPRSYTTRNRFTSFPEEQMPICVVVSPGLRGRPLMTGDGNFRAPFRIGAGVIVSATDQPTTNDLAKLYGAAIRSIMIQQGGMMGLASQTTWEDESYDDVPIPDADRTIMSVQVVATVEVEAVVNRWAGPTDPFAPDPEGQPGSEWPTANTVIIEIIKKPLIDEGG